MINHVPSSICQSSIQSNRYICKVPEWLVHGSNVKYEFWGNVDLLHVRASVVSTNLPSESAAKVLVRAQKRRGEIQIFVDNELKEPKRDFVFSPWVMEGQLVI